jgi:murein DD-endopeptidase MepM/ murein hydrolase activator NlpD
MARAKNNYQLPLKKDSIQRCTNRLSTCHVGKLKHSLDFYCEEGTPIYAAKGGLVVFVQNDSNVSGLTKKYYNLGNRLVLEHENGEYTAYEHMRYKGIVVDRGQRVKRGQIVAYSGNTGITMAPHLHFEVFNNPNRKKTEGTTLQITLKSLLE